VDPRPLRGAAPREISSRSSGVSASLDLRPWGGATPPWALSIPWIEPGSFLSALEMSLMDFPAFYRSHISFLLGQVRTRRAWGGLALYSTVRRNVYTRLDSSENGSVTFVVARKRCHGLRSVCGVRCGACQGHRASSEDLPEELSFSSMFIEGRLSLCDADTGTAFASEERRKVSASLLDPRGIFQGETGHVGDGSALP
jgi:hypothetical protein